MLSDDVAVVGGSQARADAEQGVEGRCGVAAAVPAEHELVEVAAQMGAAQAMEGSEGSVAKSGYLVTCLRDLPRGVEA